MKSAGSDYQSWVERNPPLIVVGMHRSGTSLMVRLMRDLGIHMGAWLSRDAEAVHLQKLNRGVFSRAGSRWGRVDDLLRAMRSESFVERESERLARALVRHSPLSRKPYVAAFFGDDLWAKVRLGEAFPWGWKDPRTSLLVPIWERVFPQARWVHVLRNGVDVAVSLRRRSEVQRQNVLKRVLPLDYCADTLDLGYGLRLWETYVSRTMEDLSAIPADRQLLLRYEDLLADPVRELRRVTALVGYDAPDEALASVCRRIDRGRPVDPARVAGLNTEIGALGSNHLMRDLGYSVPGHPRGEGAR